ADRVSINPQTMNDAVLRAVGRPHTAADVERAYEKALQAGFTSVNMDLIAGLTGDDPDSFERSLRRVLALEPSNVTVHTLALKKGADLFQNRAGLPDQAAVETMVRTADELLAARGYEPYYLYRQKYMSGSLENVGWCRDGDRCLYNIYMMEELHSILALGGGAVSKRMLSPTKLERQCNPKYPKEYVARIEDVLAAKRDLIAALAAPDADPNRKEPTEYEN
ncbi:MAG: coproporphyrinogen dehydrogenase HemZ, partial [Oscillospiraceae bacterium]|nr:coproporphyrinogen dehydrogenase HemZ [Oscillospiraceae bacterium]